MKRFVLKGWLLLLYFDLVMRLNSFRRLYEIVSNERVRLTAESSRPSSVDLCHAMDLASAFYFKPVLCLQRAAATTLFLRRHGWEAEMVIGAQVLPFKSHAWVEIDATVVNDKPYMLDLYQVLKRC
jgi:Transglutaminase-like superfamily